ncbi:hypothetical protein KHA80_14495 [Anaerobacillus sp. HL2]|nr:hypothetical protein KHA80_14495 [Anaerobacillus sp. HL2]
MQKRFTKIRTPGAIERVLSLLSMQGKIKEWFEYAVSLIAFKSMVEVTTRGLSDQNIALLERLVHAYKRNSARLRKINFFLTSNMKTYFASTTQVGEEITVYPWRETRIETSYVLGSASLISRDS